MEKQAKDSENIRNYHAAVPQRVFSSAGSGLWKAGPAVSLSFGARIARPAPTVTPTHMLRPAHVTPRRRLLPSKKRP